MPRKPIKLPAPTKQLQVHQMLLVFRKTVLHDALRAALADVDPVAVAAEMAQYAPADGRKVLASAGIRDEEVFMVPSVLKKAPRLLGYYRLVLGVPQKQFYRADTGVGSFSAMETRGVIPPRVADRIDELCTAMNEVLGSLVAQLAPTITPEDLAQLPLLVLGVQVDGVLRNTIGATATAGVFDALERVIAGTGVVVTRSKDGRRLSLINAAGRIVTVKLASDPDAVIEEKIGTKTHFKVAIEIKGGTDASNAHNRAGEAEKSHQKVSKKASDFWTIISLKGLDIDMIKRESPTTQQWFDVSEVLAGNGLTWQQFEDRVIVACGI